MDIITDNRITIKKGNPNGNVLIAASHGYDSYRSYRKLEVKE